MTPERFREIVEAYGALPQRWPEKERAAAEAFARRNTEAQNALVREAALDRLLDAYRVAPPNRELTRAMVASGPSSGMLPWTSILKGLGIAGAGLAGAIAGAVLMAVYAPPPPPLVDEDHQPIFTSFDVGVGDFDLGETQ